MEFLTKEDCYIRSDYLTAIKHDHCINQELILNVYKMLNGRHYQYALQYYTTLYGYCKSCNVTLDSSSEARLSASITLILADDIKDDLLVRPEGLNWFDCAYQIKKEYTMINEETGEKETKEVKYGFVFPNQSGFTYNAESRELSISGADIITALSDIRGGHIHDDATSDIETGIEYWRNQGALFMGSEKDYVRSNIYTNFYQRCIDEGKTSEEISAMWKEGYDFHFRYYEDNKYQFPNQADSYMSVGNWTVYEMVQEVWWTYMAGMHYHQPYVHLWNQHQHLPKDLEFDGTATLLDIYKAIVDLYPNQCVYFDNNARLILEELPCSHNDRFQDCRNFSREFMDIVDSETVNYNLENVVNYVVVFGKDNSCAGMYEVRTGWQCLNENCQGVYDAVTKKYVHPIYAEYRDVCPACDGEMTLVGEENELSTDRIGIHKKVINCDTYYTDEECELAAKAECLMANKFNETISLTLTDTWLSIYELYNLGIGRKIEYTPISTGETNVYTLDKLSIDHSSGQVNLELTRFYPIRTNTSAINMLEWRGHNSADLVEPFFEGYELSDTGLLSLYISNGNNGIYSLYKIYQEVNFTFSDGEYQYGITTRNKFIGETCEELSEEECIEKGFACDRIIKVFHIQLYKDGVYRFRARAYNPNLESSQYSSTRYKNPLDVKVEIFGNHLMADGYNPLLLEDENYLYVT